MTCRKSRYWIHYIMLLIYHLLNNKDRADFEHGTWFSGCPYLIPRESEMHRILGENTVWLKRWTEASCWSVCKKPSVSEEKQFCVTHYVGAGSSTGHVCCCLPTVVSRMSQVPDTQPLSPPLEDTWYCTGFHWWRRVSSMCRKWACNGSYHDPPHLLRALELHSWRAL